MIEKLDNYLKRQMYNKVFDNCCYYIYCNKEEYIGTIGNTNKDTIYNIQNIIDILVYNILICRLMDEKELNLLTKVNKYIDTLKYDDILIMHLLTHSSGLVNKIDNKKFDAGTNVKINDINFKLLRKVLENVYNTDIELLARSLIFEPLGMNDTKLIKNHVSTTINDISHFIKMILNNGYYNHKFIIDNKYIDTWFAPLFTNGDIRTTIGWLYAPSTKLCNNIDFTSNTIAFDNNNYIIIDRDNELGIALIFNKINKDKRNNINKYIFKLLNEYKKIY